MCDDPHGVFLPVDRGSPSRGQQQERRGSGLRSRDDDGEQGAHPALNPGVSALLPQHQKAGLALPRSQPASEKLSNESRSAKSDSPLAKGCNLLLAGLEKKKIR